MLQILLDVVGVLRDDLQNLLVQGLSLLRVLLAQSVRLLESVSYFMVEIYFLPELLQVLILYLLVEVVFDLIFSGTDLQSRLNLIDSSISVQVVLGLVPIRIHILL